jgi:hypothetical protein
MPIFREISKQSPAVNSTFAVGGVSCSADNFVVNEKLVFQTNFFGKSPALRVGAERQAQVTATVLI